MRATCTGVAWAGFTLVVVRALPGRAAEPPPPVRRSGGAPRSPSCSWRSERRGRDLGAEDAVVGTFGAEQLLQGLFPRYLGELRHTAFARDDPALLAEYAREASLHPDREFMSEPVTIEHDSSATHAAERFLHSDCDALPVVEHGRFVGMLGRSEFCRAMLDAAT